MINFCCVLYGTKYPVEYAQNLYNMVKRHLTIQHKFYIYTDNVRLKNIIQGDVIVQQFPLHDMNGWWNKMQLFNPDTGLTGVNLYMDLLHLQIVKLLILHLILMVDRYGTIQAL